MYVAVCADHTVGHNYCAYSTDAINWNYSNLGAFGGDQRKWQTICYGNGKFVTVEDRCGYSACYQKYYPSNLTYID